jgi:hypothetical protein
MIKDVIIHKKGADSMEWFWNWGGECFGYREGDALYAYHGLQVGRFDEDEVYGSDGRYLGEIMSERSDALAVDFRYTCRKGLLWSTGMWLGAAWLLLAASLCAAQGGPERLNWR